MKILVMGGTGVIGGHAALHLKSLGHDVTISGRKPVEASSAAARLPFVAGDYVAGDFSAGDLAPYEAVVFAAGADGRHVPEGADFFDYVLHVNGVVLPAFAALCRDAGVRKFVHIGSFYPHVAPELLEANGYIRSRKLASDGVTALASDDFHVVSLDAPFVVGIVPGQSNGMFAAYTQYAEGKMAGFPVFGPAGGTNFISNQSLSEAIAGALERGENGKVYLVGDENLSFADYFGLFFAAVGNDQPVPSLDQEHPLLPDAAIFTGRGSVVAYEPDAADAAQLGYRRRDVRRSVEEIVAQFRSHD